MSQLVYSSQKGNAITDSLRVAKAFGKRHANVLRDIRALQAHLATEACQLTSESATKASQPTSGSAAIFHPWHYLDRQHKKRELFLLNRAAFTLLVLGFTGKKAAEFKQGYIEQFDRMEAQLRTPPPTVPLPDFTKPAVQVQQVKATASRLFRLNGDPNDIMAHHRGVMKCLTARTPSQYVRDAVARGLRVRSLSGRQVLRRLEPAKAATAGFLDEQVARGHTLEQLTAADVPATLTAAFAAMLRCGITPAELPPS